jgi:hypothetical protein
LSLRRHDNFGCHHYSVFAALPAEFLDCFPKIMTPAQ